MASSSSHLRAGLGPSRPTTMAALALSGSARRDQVARASGSQGQGGPDVGKGESLDPLEVGEGPGQSEDPVHPAQGEVAAFEGGHEPAAERSAESSVGASEIGAGYLGVEAPRGVCQPALCGPAGTQDAPRHRGTGLSLAGGREVGGADGTDLNLDVDPVQQWAGQS